MGTRGAIVFVADGQTKVIYNHYDSYPDGLGVDILNWLSNTLSTNKLQDVEIEPLLKRAITNLTPVDENGEPTPEQQERVKQYHEQVSTGKDWYSWLRGTQGNPGAILTATYYVEAGTDWLRDSLFCEWAYVVDFDLRVFEVHEGFQSQPHDKGRFAVLGQLPAKAGYSSGREYYPVALKLVIPFDDLPDEGRFAISIDKGELMDKDLYTKALEAAGTDLDTDAGLRAALAIEDESKP